MCQQLCDNSFNSSRANLVLCVRRRQLKISSASLRICLRSWLPSQHLGRCKPKSRRSGLCNYTSIVQEICNSNFNESAQKLLVLLGCVCPWWKLRSIRSVYSKHWVFRSRPHSRMEQLRVKCDFLSWI